MILIGEPDTMGYGEPPEVPRVQHAAPLRERHGRYRWAHCIHVALGLWLLATPPALDLRSRAMAASDMAAGLGLVVFGALSIAWCRAWVAIGTWVMASPLVFWAPSAAGYLNDTLVGMAVVALRC